MKTCSACESYNKGLGRCVYGKIIPKTIKGGAEAARWMGIDYICNKFGHRDKVFARIEKEWKELLESQPKDSQKGE